MSLAPNISLGEIGERMVASRKREWNEKVKPRLITILKECERELGVKLLLLRAEIDEIVSLEFECMGGKEALSGLIHRMREAETITIKQPQSTITKESATIIANIFERELGTDENLKKYYNKF